MKIQIKNLEPNPYRDIKKYPINEIKVQRLVDSIKQTGFWDNILARKADGKIQIAYGHHRLVALRRIMKLTDEVDIPVKPLDDATMIKVMANENIDEWRTAPAVIDETVRITKEFLEEHPKEKELVSRGRPNQPVGAPMISDFLGWPQSRITYALERLHLIDTGELDSGAIAKLPTERAGRDFVKAIRQVENVSPEIQKRAADRIVQEQSLGESQVKRIILEEKFRDKKQIKEGKKIEFEDYLDALQKDVERINLKIDKVLEYKDIFDSDFYRKTIERFHLLLSIKKLSEKIDILSGENHVKQIQRKNPALPPAQK